MERKGKRNEKSKGTGERTKRMKKKSEEKEKGRKVYKHSEVYLLCPPPFAPTAADTQLSRQLKGWLRP